MYSIMIYVTKLKMLVNIIILQHIYRKQRSSSIKHNMRSPSYDHHQELRQFINRP